MRDSARDTSAEDLERAEIDLFFAQDGMLADEGPSDGCASPREVGGGEGEEEAPVQDGALAVRLCAASPAWGAAKEEVAERARDAWGEAQEVRDLRREKEEKEEEDRKKKQLMDFDDDEEDDWETVPRHEETAADDVDGEDAFWDKSSPPDPGFYPRKLHVGRGRERDVAYQAHFQQEDEDEDEEGVSCGTFG